MEDRAAHIEGGPGWHIDPDTLLPAIDDEVAFRAAHCEDPYVEALVLLWTGRPAQAEAELTARGAADSIRGRALIADTWRDQGRVDEAIAAYEQLVREVAGTGREAVIRQHLGKAWFVAGRYAAAAREFDHALALRVVSDAPESLVESSRRAAERARSLC